MNVFLVAFISGIANFTCNIAISYVHYQHFRNILYISKYYYSGNYMGNLRIYLLILRYNCLINSLFCINVSLTCDISQYVKLFNNVVDDNASTL